MDGWIKLYRKMANHPDWNNGHFDIGKAFADLLILANWKDSHIRKRGVTVPVARGELARSIKGLASRWNWSQSRVKTALRHWQTQDQIEYQITNVTTVITITNYDSLQETDEQIDNQTETRPRPDRDQTETRPRHKKKDKKERKEEGKNKEGAGKPAFSPEDTPLPDGLDSQAFLATWQAWCAHRREIRRRLTPTSVKQQIATLERLGEAKAIAMIRHTIAQGWIGLREPANGQDQTHSRVAKPKDTEGWRP